MVYCNYISNTKDTATYAYGATTDDITGILVFNISNETIYVKKEPVKDSPTGLFLRKLYAKHRDNFKKGTFPKKIAYEI